MKRILLIILTVTALALVLLKAADSIYSPETDSDSDSPANKYASYALFFGLNPTNIEEACLDYDGDNLSNWQESFILTDPLEQDTDHDFFPDNFDAVPISRAYFPFGVEQFTLEDAVEYAHPDWVLGGAWKMGGEWITNPPAWRVAGSESNSASLSLALDRAILLTNNLRYAVHFEGGSASAVVDRATASGHAVMNSSLFLDLLDTNGVVVAENLYGNLLAVSNAAGYAVIPAEAGIQSNNVVLLNIPTAKFPDAAVIQLKHGTGEIIIYEVLLYIDEDGDGLDADQEKQIGASDYSIDSNHNGTNDYDECFNAGSSTNNPGDVPPPPPPPPPEDDDKDKGIVYIDQSIGNDAYSGREPYVGASLANARSVAIASTKGPKKTVRAGLAIAETNDTIIIKSGNYNENLHIQGRDIRVIIAGKVRL